MTRRHHCCRHRRRYRRHYRHHWAVRFILKPIFWLVVAPLALLAFCA